MEQPFEENEIQYHWGNSSRIKLPEAKTINYGSNSVFLRMDI